MLFWRILLCLTGGGGGGGWFLWYIVKACMNLKECFLVFYETFWASRLRVFSELNVFREKGFS